MCALSTIAELLVILSYSRPSTKMSKRVRHQWRNTLNDDGKRSHRSQDFQHINVHLLIFSTVWATFAAHASEIEVRKTAGKQRFLVCIVRRDRQVSK